MQCLETFLVDITGRTLLTPSQWRLGVQDEPPQQRTSGWQFPTFLAPGTGFMEDNFSMDGVGGVGWGEGGRDDFRMTQVHYIYCAL